nr:hypothetical protein [Candidatus Sigynarchaeum springense]
MTGNLALISAARSRDRLDDLHVSLKTYTGRLSDLQSRYDYSSAGVIHKQIERIRADINQQYSKVEASLDGMAENLESVLVNQANIEKILKDKLGLDWDKIRDAWAAYKRGERSFGDLLKGALKELGKRDIRKIIEAIAGGLL